MARQPGLTLTAKEVYASSHLQKLLKGWVRSMGLTQIKQAHVRKRYLLDCIRRRRRRMLIHSCSSKNDCSWERLASSHENAWGHWELNPLQTFWTYSVSVRIQSEKHNEWAHVIGGLSQGMGSHDHGRWLGWSETHRAGRQEGQATRLKLWPTCRVSSSLAKPQLCL